MARPERPVILGTATAAYSRPRHNLDDCHRSWLWRALPHGAGAAPAKTTAGARRRAPKRPALTGPLPPPPGAPTKTTPPRVVLSPARLSFGSSRRWPQWELNTDVLEDFFGVTVSGNVIQREAVTQAGAIQPPTATPLVIGRGRNRRLEFPEPDGRPDPHPAEVLLVVVDRRPSAFRYSVLLPTTVPTPLSTH